MTPLDTWRLCRLIELEYGKPIVRQENAEFYEKQLSFLVQVVKEFSDICRVDVASDSARITGWIVGKLLVACKGASGREGTLKDALIATALSYLSELSPEAVILILDEMFVSLEELMMLNLEMRAGGSMNFMTRLLGSEKTALLLECPSNPLLSFRLDYILVCISNLEDCELFQNVLCSLLFRCEDLDLVSKQTLTHAFPDLLKQVELGDYCLKTSTLWLLQRLLAMNYCPQLFAPFLVDHLLALSEWLMENCDTNSGYE